MSEGTIYSGQLMGVEWYRCELAIAIAPLLASGAMESAIINAMAKRRPLNRIAKVGHLRKPRDSRRKSMALCVIER